MPSSLSLAAAALAAASAATSSAYPTLTLGSLDGKPGFAVVELNPSMALAYDKEGASLWLAWQGTARGAEGPAAPGEARLLRDGPVYHTRRTDQPWSAAKGGKPLPVTASLRQAVMEDGLPKLGYALRIGSDTVRVDEYPQFDDHYGAKALFRYFVFTGMPKGVTVTLDLRGRPPREGEKPKFSETGQETLVQTGDGKVRVKVSWPEMQWGAGF